MSMKDAIKQSKDAPAPTSSAMVPAESTAVDVMSTLTELGGVSDESGVVHSDTEIPWIGFHHPKSGKYAEVSAVLPDLKTGDPYLSFRGYSSVEGCRLQVLDKMYQCWQHTSPRGDLVALTEEERPYPFKEAIAAVVLVYMGDTIIPTMTTFRGAQTRCVHDFNRAAETASAPEWAGNDKTRAKLVKLPSRMRIAMSLNMASKTNTNGEYHIANGVCSALTFEELATLSDWQKTPEAGERLGRVLSFFDRKVADLKAARR